MPKGLNAENALIFRITHRANLRWTLQNGLFCASSKRIDPNFVPIGNPDLIARRRERTLPAPFAGVLSDYVPFYFTPHSPMMYNIKTGWGGITKRRNDEIVILVSSLWRLQEYGVRFVFTDRHAYLRAARFYDDPAHLNQIDWDLLERRDFKRDPNDPGKFERYEAEALAYEHVPVTALWSVACNDTATRATILADARAAGTAIEPVVRPGWYFA